MKVQATLDYLKARTPGVFDTVARDLMDVVNITGTAGPAGGRIKHEVADYSAVMVEVVPSQRLGEKNTLSAKLTAEQRHILSFSMFDAEGSRRTISAVNHRLIVRSRGDDTPQRIFRIIDAKDLVGVNVEVECIEEG